MFHTADDEAQAEGGEGRPPMGSLPLTLREGAGGDRLDRPHPLWWPLVAAAFALLGAWGVPAVHGWWTARVFPLPSPGAMQAAFAIAVLIHALEAAAAFRIARALGYSRSANAWALQTFALGFPSLRLLLARRRTMGELVGRRPE